MTSDPQEPIEAYRRALADLLGVDEVDDPPWKKQYIAEIDQLAARVEERQQAYGEAFEQLFHLAQSESPDSSSLSLRWGGARD